MVSVRYIVVDLAASVAFYCEQLGFAVDMQPTDDFARVSKGDLRLYLNTPGTGAGGKAGGSPTPGGWNRIQIEVADLETEIARLKGKVEFRGEAVQGMRSKQILIVDPSGNLVELSQKTSGSRL